MSQQNNLVLSRFTQRQLTRHTDQMAYLSAIAPGGEHGRDAGFAGCERAGIKGTDLDG